MVCADGDQTEKAQESDRSLPQWPPKSKLNYMLNEIIPLTHNADVGIMGLMPRAGLCRIEF